VPATAASQILQDGSIARPTDGCKSLQILMMQRAAHLHPNPLLSSSALFMALSHEVRLERYFDRIAIEHHSAPVLSQVYLYVPAHRREHARAGCQIQS
jgi:hypothetical protein